MARQRLSSQEVDRKTGERCHMDKEKGVQRRMGHLLGEVAGCVSPLG